VVVEGVTDDWLCISLSKMRVIRCGLLLPVVCVGCYAK